jgi:hypothetical protein
MDSIASIVVTPYQESVNRVRVMGGGVLNTGKVYTNIHDASNYFGSPDIDNQCLVMIEGTGNSYRYLTMIPNTLRDYVNFRGAGRHINIIMSDGSSNYKIVNFEDMTLLFGAGDYGVDRQYVNMKFINCRIFAYKNTIFHNCELINCEIIHASTYKSFLTNSTLAFNCVFNNEFDDSGITDGKVLNCSSGFTFTLPDDPTVPV